MRRWSATAVVLAGSVGFTGAVHSAETARKLDTSQAVAIARLGG
jgi:precorrin isomerase